MLCRDYTLVKTEGVNITAMPLKCRSWGCDYCRPERANALKRLARNGKPNTFITLTVNPRFLGSSAERAAALAAAWRTIVAKAKRRYSYKKLEYLCVFEATKAGEPHLHILARCKWLDQRWLSAQMALLMRAPICDIRRVKSLRHIARYVAKYIGKDPQRFATCKRYWTTQGWDKWHEDREQPEFGHQITWQIVRMTLSDYLKCCSELGMTVTIGRDRGDVMQDLNTYWRGESGP